MRLVLLTTGVMTLLALVLGFTLADLTKVARDQAAREDGEVTEGPAFLLISKEENEQVKVLKHLLVEVPETGEKRLKEFPRTSVAKALGELHRDAPNQSEKQRFLKLLAAQKSPESTECLEDIAKRKDADGAAARKILAEPR